MSAAFYLFIPPGIVFVLAVLSWVAFWTVVYLAIEHLLWRRTVREVHRPRDQKIEIPRGQQVKR
jgi:hypothetical protein